jgi:hypothetical protein
MEREDYLTQLRTTRVAPCPAGPFTPDTFRFYEALNSGCYPIVDARSPGAALGYWQKVYGVDFPFPIVDDWEIVGGHIETALKRWPVPALEAGSWWVRTRRKMVDQLNHDLNGIGIERDATHWSDDVTIVMTTSPVPVHPSTDDTLFTLDSVYESMGCRPQTIIACDGVRPEQHELKEAYLEYARRITRIGINSNHILPMYGGKHLHQIKLTQLALTEVTTPLLLFMEHDTPFNTEPVDWAACVDMMLYAGADVLRFHHENTIPTPHNHLMEDPVPTSAFGVPVIRTRQWSQRPHLANVDYYRRMLGIVARRPNNGFIEDAQHSVALHNPRSNRVAIYAPEGGFCRTYHTDGRAGGLKYDDVLL